MHSFHKIYILNHHNVNIKDFLKYSFVQVMFYHTMHCEIEGYLGDYTKPTLGVS